MYAKRFLMMMTVTALLFAGGPDARSQSPDADKHRFEVGGQFSLLQLSEARSVTTTASGIVINFARETEPGFGGRVGYNINNYVAVEAEANFFPRERDGGNGRGIEGLFGVKAGWRFEKAGIFGKARPGFFSERVSDFRPRSGGACPAVFPPPVGCFDEIRSRETSLAFDVGGVVELYPTTRSIVRFDIGDTIIRVGERNIRAPSTAFPQGVVVRVPSVTRHNLQGSIGIGFRF
ncbi:MAG TPA: outer membrane beta-barrel protein [Pyrinomonadaceae bacterium]